MHIYFACTTHSATHPVAMISNRAKHLEDSARWGQWMKAGQDGDQAAYSRLLSELAPVARRMAARQWAASGISEDVEDVVQEILLTLHGARHTYDPTRPFLPWFLAIVDHRVKDGLRHRRRHHGRETNIDSVPETFLSQAANTSSTDRIDLSKAVARLPAGQRQAVELLKIKEMSLAEASAASGQSVTALKVAMHRALKTLKGLLGP